MEYSNLKLFAFGMVGMLFYILMKVKTINDKTVGKFKLKDFLSLEWPTIMLSLLVIFGAILGKTEVKSLESVSDYLGLGFAFIGYGGQSVLYYFFSRIEKKLKSGEDPTINKVEDKKSDS